MKYLAHVSKDETRQQSNKEHLLGVADLCETFASKFGAGELARLIGLLHDWGKFTPLWSKYFDRKLKAKELEFKEIVDHATSGGKYAIKQFGDKFSFLGELVAYPIFGHHGGLPNYYASEEPTGKPRTPFSERKNKLINPVDLNDPDVIEVKKEIDFLIDYLKTHNDSPFIIQNERYNFQIFFFLKMLFSCLLDADFLDTEKFERNRGRESYSSLKEMQKKYDEYIEILERDASETRINKARKFIRLDLLSADFCRNKINATTIPTGGSKTLSNFGLALKQAIIDGQDRIIYIVRYTAIVGEVAKILKEIFGEENVVEHHCNFEPDDGWEEKDGWLTQRSRKTQLSTQNWGDAPIIVTTDVQFYETIYSNKPGKSRKMHNMANAYVFFDEPQILEPNFLLCCLEPLKELVLNYNTSIVLSTATQPLRYQEFLPEINRMEINELIKNTHELDVIFSRTTVENLKEITVKGLTNKIKRRKKVLAIFNTKQNAYLVYSELKKKTKKNIYFLTTDLCYAHQELVLNKVREHLKNGESCILIATSTIESGINVDFANVYREKAGIDNHQQAVGRCNREGKLYRKGSFFYFTLIDGNSASYLVPKIAATKIIEDKYDNILSLDAIEEYFQHYYVNRTSLDSKDIWNRINSDHEPFDFPFEDIRRNFRLIPYQIGVIVPYNEEAEKLIYNLTEYDKDYYWLRKLQKYTVSVYENQLEELMEMGMISRIDGCYVCLSDKCFYNAEVGLNITQYRNEVIHAA